MQIWVKISHITPGLSVFVLELGGMEKQDSEGLGPKKMLHLDAEGFVWPGFERRPASQGQGGHSIHPPDGPLARALCRPRAHGRPELGCDEEREQLLRGN